MESLSSYRPRDLCSKTVYGIVITCPCLSAKRATNNQSRTDL